MAALLLRPPDEQARSDKTDGFHEVEMEEGVGGEGEEATSLMAEAAKSTATSTTTQQGTIRSGRFAELTQPLCVSAVWCVSAVLSHRAGAVDRTDWFRSALVRCGPADRDDHTGGGEARLAVG